MKKLGLVVVVLVAVFSLNAQFSIAGTDDFMAPKINPAAMGVGNSGGFSLIGNYDEDGLYEDWYFYSGFSQGGLRDVYE